MTRESCCEEEANIKGYHQLEPDVWYEQEGDEGSEVVAKAPKAGGRFTWGEPLFDNGIPMEFPSQVDLIRAPNRRKHTKDKYASDFLRPGAEGLLKLEYFFGDLDNAAHRRWPYGPQIDHIIPRVDKYGCDCGSNSSNNAQVISAKLNNELSNNCSDPRRIEIIEHYKKRKLGIIPIQFDPEWEPGAQSLLVQESSAANLVNYAPSVLPALRSALLQAFDALIPAVLDWWSSSADHNAGNHVK